MKRYRRFFAAILVFVLIFASGCPVLPAKAGGAYIDSPYWQEITYADLNAKYNNGEDFIVVYHKFDCFYSNSFKSILE